MFIKASSPIPCSQLLQDYKKNKCVYSSEKLIFKDINNKDVYNITSIISEEKLPIIAGRLESRDSEIAEVTFFSNQNGLWSYLDESIVFSKMQDPFFTYIDKNLVLGGVAIETDPSDNEKIVNWTTRFYQGSDIFNLKPVAEGPKKMKDIRVIELNNGNIGVFTRPQGDIFGMGKIGYVELNSLSDLNESTVLRAQIYHTHFIDGEWGGCNEIHLLNNGLIGVLGHIAYLDTTGGKHYHAMTFSFNPETKETSNVKIIATREDFSSGASKREDLVDVLFSGGIVRMSDGKAKLFAGLSDAEAHTLVIDDPFLEYEA